MHFFLVAFKKSKLIKETINKLYKFVAKGLYRDAGAFITYSTNLSCVLLCEFIYRE